MYKLHWYPEELESEVPPGVRDQVEILAANAVAALEAQGEVVGDVTVVDTGLSGGKQQLALIPIAPNSPEFDKAARYPHREHLSLGEGPFGTEVIDPGGGDIFDDDDALLETLAAGMVALGTTECPSCHGLDPECPIQAAIDAELERRRLEEETDKIFLRQLEAAGNALDALQSVDDITTQSALVRAAVHHVIQDMIATGEVFDLLLEGLRAFLKRRRERHRRS